MKLHHDHRLHRILRKLTPPQLEALQRISDRRECYVSGARIRVYNALAEHGFCTKPAIGNRWGGYQYLYRPTEAGIAAAQLVPAEVFLRVPATAREYLVAAIAHGEPVKTNDKRTPLAELRAYAALDKLKCVRNLDCCRGDHTVFITQLGKAVAIQIYNRALQLNKSFPTTSHDKEPTT